LLRTEQEQLSFARVALRFRVGEANVVHGSKRLKPKRTKKKPATQIDIVALVREVEMYPEAYQSERAVRLGVSQRGIGKALKRLGVSRKPNPFTFASRG
jgi:Transposase